MKFSINKFLLYIILTLFITTHSFGCALCNMQIPKVHVDTKIFALPDKTHFEVVWGFEKKFLAQLGQYDLNGNGKFDPDEQAAITKALEDYLVRFNYLTQVSYTKRGFNSNKMVKIKPISTKMVFKNATMYYYFNFDTNFILQNDHTLTIQFQDKQQNFNFLLKDAVLKKYHNKYSIKPMEHYAKVFLNDPTILATQIMKKTIKKNIDKNSTENNIKIKPIKSNNLTPEKDIQAKPKLNIFFQQLSKQLQIYKEKMKVLLTDIKQNNSVSSYFWLLFFSFIYGVLHALGPGHGKTLVASYFLTENHSVLKAFNISLLIGIVHTFSAFLLTVAIYLVLNLFFVSFVTNVDYVATKLSATIIIAIASYLLYKKYRSSKKIANKMTFSVYNPNAFSCGCSACNTKSEDLGVILAAGIVPCPGTVTIFIFTSGLGIYYVGFLSAIFMSLGMSLIIFITSYLSIKIRKRSSSNTVLKKVFEYGSLLFILCLGFFLLLV